jgi:hypothetical protein
VEGRLGVPFVREVNVVANLVGVATLMLTAVKDVKANVVVVVVVEETLLVSSQEKSSTRCSNIEMMADARPRDSTLTMLSSQPPRPSLDLALLVMLPLVKGRLLLSSARPLMKLLVRLIMINHLNLYIYSIPKR